MFSSNTIPIGWILCNGSLQSALSYAVLYDLIQGVYNHVIPYQLNPTTLVNVFCYQMFKVYFKRSRFKFKIFNIIGQTQNANAMQHYHLAGSLRYIDYEATRNAHAVTNSLSSVHVTAVGPLTVDTN